VILANDILFGAIIGSILYMEGLILFATGQPLISPSGQIKVFEDDITGPESSQQISDWYTLRHVVHGFVFYTLGMGAASVYPSKDLGVRGFFIVALLLEGLWEVIENSAPVVNRFRQGTLDYAPHGDSILNSFSDMVAMSIGYWVASLLSPLTVLGLIVAEEIILSIVTRESPIEKVIQVLNELDSYPSNV